MKGEAMMLWGCRIELDHVPWCMCMTCDSSCLEELNLVVHRLSCNLLSRMASFLYPGAVHQEPCVSDNPMMCELIVLNCFSSYHIPQLGQEKAS